MTTKVTLFVGLKDKDTKRQEIETSAANDVICEAVVRLFGFGTVSLASGVYSHSDGSNAIVVENTIRIDLLFFDSSKAETREKIWPFVSEMKTKLNQESICLEASTVDAELL